MIYSFVIRLPSMLLLESRQHFRLVCLYWFYVPLPTPKGVNDVAGTLDSVVFPLRLLTFGLFSPGVERSDHPLSPLWGLAGSSVLSLSCLEQVW